MPPTRRPAESCRRSGPAFATPSRRKVASEKPARPHVAISVRNLRPRFLRGGQVGSKPATSDVPKLASPSF